MDFNKYTVKPAEEAIKDLGTDIKHGLKSAEINARLKQFGYNQIEAKETKWWNILIRQFSSSFVYLLVGAAILAFILREFIDGMMIVIFVAINSGLGFYQEYKSEKTLKLLKNLIVSRAKVRRDGKEFQIDSKELVPGDIILLSAGDLVQADARIIKSNSLKCDESVLTGESCSVEKMSEVLLDNTFEIFNATNTVFSGTTIVGGKGEAVVISTGKESEIGGVAKMAVEGKRESMFEKNLNIFSTFILRLVFITLVLVFAANIFIKGPGVNFIELVIFSIALAVSVIPEALLVVTTFSLSRGALHLAKNKVVIKRLSAIEDLGGIEVLCTDKTGTLTENKLSISEVFAKDKDKTILFGNLAGVFVNEDERSRDSFDTALYEGLKKKTALDSFIRINDLPFNPMRRNNSVLVRDKDKKLVVILRGAPEFIIESSKLDKKEKDEYLKWLIEKGKEGKRVLGVASKPIKKETDYNDKQDLSGLDFHGVISFVDPIKKTAKRSVEDAKELGITVKIITGDSREVAGAVAREISIIADQSEVLTGEELELMPPERQTDAVLRYNVFARVSPLQKFRIIELLRDVKEVGYLGEGINDAPALKIANVGIVVDSASDISRESADIILTKKSLAVIIEGIKEGRIVFANTIKYIRSTLTSNFGNFYAIAFASLLIDFLPMLPLQILLLNLLSDFPMIAVATDNVDDDEIKSPTKYDVREIIILASMLGMVSTIFDFIFFAIFVKFGPAVLQTNWFIGSVLTELAFLFSIRSKRFFLRAKGPSNILFYLSITAAITTLVLPLTEFGARIFKFILPTPYHLGMIFGIVVVYLASTESVKLLYYKFFHKEKIS
jgi:P-type Mg2+ transporter